VSNASDDLPEPLARHDDELVERQVKVEVAQLFWRARGCGSLSVM
jgi:hypothetical protein